MSPNTTKENFANLKGMSAISFAVVRKIAISRIALTTLFTLGSSALFAADVSGATASHLKSQQQPKVLRTDADSSSLVLDRKAQFLPQTTLGVQTVTEDSILQDAAQVKESTSLRIDFEDGSSVSDQQAKSVIKNAPDVQTVSEDSAPDDFTQVQRNKASATAKPYSRKLSCRSGGSSLIDRQGRMTLRNNCRYNNVNWGFKIDSKLRAIAIGPVTEHGARWWKNDVVQKANALHVEPPDYHFHGTFPGVRNYDKIAYYDVYTFQINAGGKVGRARLSVGGTFQVVP